MAKRSLLKEKQASNLAHAILNAQILQEGYGQIALAKQTVTQAEENLRIQRNYYNAGTSFLSDIPGQRSSDATAAYYNAVSAYRIATGK